MALVLLAVVLLRPLQDTSVAYVLPLERGMTTVYVPVNSGALHLSLDANTPVPRAYYRYQGGPLLHACGALASLTTPPWSFETDEGSKTELYQLRCDLSDDARAPHLELEVACVGECTSDYFPVQLYFPFGDVTKKQLSSRELNRLPMHHKSLEVVGVRYGSLARHVQPKSCTGASKSRECLDVIGMLSGPDIARSPGFDRAVIDTALGFRATVIPILMIGMVAMATYCLAHLIGLSINWAGHKFEWAEDWCRLGEWTRRREILLVWCSSLGPALGFALTVVGLAAAFGSSAGGSEQLSPFGDAIAIALSSTLLGLGVRVIADTALSVLDVLTVSHQAQLDAQIEEELETLRLPLSPAEAEDENDDENEADDDQST